MTSVTLNGRSTSRLGFGCSLLGSTSPAVSRNLLAAAFEAGIRHFDVAPMYAFGRAERLLCESLGSRINQVTITTKYGLAPPSNPGWMHRLARSALSSFPALKQRLGAASREALAQPDPPLTAASAEQSIHASLRELNVPAIDLLLLHEATPARLGDERLLDLLESLKRAGKIREFGIGSRSERVVACLREAPACCNFLQFEWSVFSLPEPGLEIRPHINHGSLAGSRLNFTDWLLRNPTRCTRWSEAVGADLDQPGMLPRLLLKAALDHHPDGIVLFSTRTLANIRENVATAENDSLLEPARSLHRQIQKEYQCDLEAEQIP